MGSRNEPKVIPKTDWAKKVTGPVLAVEHTLARPSEVQEADA